MTRFIIFVTLLGVQFACGVSETVVTVYKDGTALLDVPSGDRISECKLETNTGEEYKFDRTSTADLTDRIKAGYGMLYPLCTVRVLYAKAEDAGIWKITAFEKNGKNPQEYRFQLYLEETAAIYPSSNVMYVEKGNYAHVKLVSEFKNLTRCSVTTPQGNSVDMLATKKSGLERYGSCGFSTLAKLEDSGKWKIDAVVGSSLFYKNSILMQVFEDEDVATEMPVFKYKNGERAFITVGSKTASFCQLTDPKGINLPFIHGPCILNLHSVTPYHVGFWVARYGIKGGMNVTTLPFEIIVHKPRIFNTSVNITKNGEVELLCQGHIHNLAKFRFCRFTSPDGQMLNLSPGVGNERYSAFKVSEIGQSVIDPSCGLLIHQVRESDYGTWKCEVSMDYEDQFFGSLLRVVEPTSTEYSSDNVITGVRAPDVYVKQGDPYTVKCTADAALDYCWFRSPNGTAYAVSYDGRSDLPYFLPYDGAGLSMGECGAKIDKSVNTDHGKWTCNLGVANSTEESTTVSVSVTDSYLVAQESSITLNKNGQTTLKCNILPSLEYTVITYCRWVRPDGYGIRNVVSSRYTTSNTASECKLVILNEKEQEDLGRWTCVAGLTGMYKEELWAQITIYSGSSGFGTLIGLIMMFCILLTISGFVCALIYVRKRRRALPKNPPAYSPEEQLPVPGYLKPNDVSKEFQY